jgi:hypothetical protein
VGRVARLDGSRALEGREYVARPSLGPRCGCGNEVGMEDHNEYL